MSRVEAVLGAARAAGRPSLVGYVTAGIRADWTGLLAAMIDAGADAVEIGLPFSDPMLDGPVIQQASAAALGRGANTTAILAELRRARPRAGQDGEVPLIAMSYANHAYGRGLARYCADLAEAGFSGTIIPDLPAAEAGEYLAAAAARGPGRHPDGHARHAARADARHRPAHPWFPLRDERDGHHGKHQRAGRRAPVGAGRPGAGCRAGGRGRKDR